MHNYPVFYLPGPANFDFLGYSTVQFWHRLNSLSGKRMENQLARAERKPYVFNKDLAELKQGVFHIIPNMIPWTAVLPVSG